jgi:C4-dicarboxylate transporter DctQ subunit
MSRFQRLIENIEVAFNYLSQACCLLIMFAVTLQVVLRYVFNFSLAGIYTGVELLMIIVVFLSLAYTQQTGGHIRMELIISRLRGNVRHITEALLSFLALFGFAILTWQGGKYALIAFMIGDYEAGLVQFPLWPSKTAVFAGSLLLCLRFTIDIGNHLAKIRLHGNKE